MLCAAMKIIVLILVLALVMTGAHSAYVRKPCSKQLSTIVLSFCNEIITYVSSIF